MPWKDLGKVVGSNGTVGNVGSTYINNGGDPGVSITRSGDDNAPDITFNFENLVNDPLTESEIEQITNGVSVNSSRTANGTVLTSIWAGIKAKFAAKSHAHDASDITTGQLAAALIANGTITEEMLAAAAVSTGKIGAKAVTEAKLGDGAVATAKLADDAVTGDKIAGGSIGKAHLDEEMTTLCESLSQTLTDTGWVDLYYIVGKTRIRARRVGHVVTITGESIGHYDVGGSTWVNITTLPAQFRPSKRPEVAFNLADDVAGGVRSYLEETGEFYVFCTASSCKSWGCIATYVV